MAERSKYRPEIRLRIAIGIEAGFSGNVIKRALRDEGIRFGNDVFNRIFREIKFSNSVRDQLRQINPARSVPIEFISPSARTLSDRYLFTGSIRIINSQSLLEETKFVSISSARRLSPEEIADRIAESLLDGSNERYLEEIQEVLGESFRLERAERGPNVIR